MRILGIVALGATLASCAREGAVAVGLPTTQYLNCTAISAEIATNNKRVAQLAADKGRRATQTGATNIAGMFVPILWFIDFQDTADTEIATLQNRQRYLLVMADQYRCGADHAPNSSRPKR